MLAIAAPSFGTLSETFVRAHVQSILPEQTVLMCLEGAGAGFFSHPILSDIAAFPPHRSPAERLCNALRLRWIAYVDQQLSGADERRVRQFLLRNGVTHCLAEFGPTGARIASATERAGVKLYVHFHGYDATVLPREWRWRRHFRRLFISATGIIAPSKYIAKVLSGLGCPPDKLHVSACGVDLDNYGYTGADPHRVVAVGRLVNKKAPLAMIDAFIRATSEMPNAHLDVIGSGPLEYECHALVRRHGASRKVTFHGAQPHDAVKRLISRAALFVQHSVTAPNGDMEGLPVGILEAMAAGLPVVSTRHSGIPEAVIEGQTGLLVDEGDVSGMSDGIRRLLLDSDWAKALGAAGRDRAEKKFSHAVTALRLREIMGLK